MRLTRLLPALAVVLATAVGACGVQREGSRDIAVPGGQAGRGPEVAELYGCGACHEMPGVGGADGQVGPPLTDFGRRATIAGRLPNRPDNLVRWIMDPQEIDPGVDMPDLGVDEEDARDLAAYLLSLG